MTGSITIERRRLARFQEGDYVTDVGSDVYLVIDLDDDDPREVGCFGMFKCIVEETAPPNWSEDRGEFAPCFKLHDEFGREARRFAKIAYEPGDQAPFEPVFEYFTEVISPAEVKRRELSAAISESSTEAERDRLIAQYVAGSADPIGLTQIIRSQWVGHQFSKAMLAAAIPFNGANLLDVLARRE